MTTSKDFPVLYTLTSTKATQYWAVKAVLETDGQAYVIREYGQMGTKKPITNKKQIMVAKSQGDLFMQAIFEAEGDWNNKKNKKGYVTDITSLSTTVTQLQDNAIEAKIVSPAIEQATQQSGKISIKLKSLAAITKISIKMKSSVSQAHTEEKTPSLQPTKVIVAECKEEMVSGGNYDLYKTFKFLPMLANKFKEKKHNIVYPAKGQGKLDGVRFTARKLSNGKVMIRSRNDAECIFFLEIKAALEALPLKAGVFLDGEFYCKDKKILPFKTVNGYCNRKKMDGKTGYGKIPQEHINMIHYNIYDCYFVEEAKLSFDQRYEYLQKLFKHNKSPFLELVECTDIMNESEVVPLHDKLVLEGNEGLMVRNKHGVYKLKDRSNDLLKVKDFIDEEFIIIGAHAPTNGKELGCIIWDLGLPSDKSITFKCSPLGSYAERMADWELYQADPSEFIGQKYTVKFQEKYDNGIPRFPKGVAIRYD
jgi:ATP-dependent DNA ligase